MSDDAVVLVRAKPRVYRLHLMHGLLFRNEANGAHFNSVTPVIEISSVPLAMPDLDVYEVKTVKTKLSEWLDNLEKNLI